MTPLHDIQYLVIHHSLTADGKTFSWDAIRRFHKAPPPAGRGWSEIAYHVGLELIENDYEILVGRAWNLQGAHAPGRNHDSLGICLIGNFDEAPPPPNQWAQAVTLVKWMSALFKVPPDNVRGHREVTDHRTCPGKFFDLRAFRLALQDG